MFLGRVGRKQKGEGRVGDNSILWTVIFDFGICMGISGLGWSVNHSGSAFFLGFLFTFLAIV